MAARRTQPRSPLEIRRNRKCRNSSLGGFRFACEVQAPTTMPWNRDSGHGPPRHREAGDCAANMADAGRPLSFDQRHYTIMYSLLLSFNLYHDETAVGKSIVVYRHPHPWRSRAGGRAVHSITSGHVSALPPYPQADL